MKNKDIIEKMAVGDILHNRQVLNGMKRAGLIWDYDSPHGTYLMSLDVNGDVRDTFPKGWKGKVEIEGGYSQSCHPSLTEATCKGNPTEILGHPWDAIEYQGGKFKTEHVPGCFGCYLKLVGRV